MVDPRIGRSKLRIRTAFVDLLQTQDLEDVTIRQVSQLSGAGYATFYRHYETKQDLVTEIAEIEVEELTDLSFPRLALNEPYAAVCLVSAQRIAERRRLWTALTSGSASAILRRVFIRTMLERAGDTRLGSGFLPLEVTASLCGTLLVDLLTWWLRQTDTPQPEYLAEAIERIVVRPALESW